MHKIPYFQCKAIHVTVYEFYARYMLMFLINTQTRLSYCCSPPLLRLTCVQIIKHDY